MLSSGEVYGVSSAGEGRRLQNDLASVSLQSKANLQYIGLMVGDDGSISSDKAFLSRAVTPERAENTFATLSGLRDAIGKKAENIAINPMKYVNKIVVAYKNPGHNFATPYISSIYSGMMLDNYV